VFAVAAFTVLVTTGPAAVRPWRCHRAVERSSRREAVKAYYASCWSKPKQVIGMRGNEFEVLYRGKTRFLEVRQSAADGGWRVEGPEGTGP
jgi:hypothetical protein